MNALKQIFVLTTLVVVVVVSLMVGAPRSAQAVSRAEALTRARTYAQHPWHCAQANLTASCDSSYTSINVVADYVGLPYDWGGYVTIDQFDSRMIEGQGAGSQPSDGILSCTAGVDCSGFVSRVWKAGHTTTSGMHTITSEIPAADVLPADAFNAAGYHVMLLETTLANGDPCFIESIYENVHQTFWESWTYTNGFTPVRYQSISDDPATYADGTAASPVVVSTFPFVDERDTSLSTSDLFDRCLGAAPDKGEKGPEIIYRLDLSSPGVVSAAVQDDAGVDIDLHFYTALNEMNCIARDDSMVELHVGCGSVWLVADSYTSASSGEDFPGPYTVTIDFEPSGQPCGADNYPYAPGGAVGDPCGYAGAPDLQACNPNLGGVVCLYTSGVGATSFCTIPCEHSGQCAEDFPGGCCGEVDTDFYACLTPDFCEVIPVDTGPEPTVESSPESSPEPSPEPGVEPTEEVIDGPAEVLDGGPAVDTAPGQDTATGAETGAPDTATADGSTGAEASAADQSGASPDGASGGDDTAGGGDAEGGDDSGCALGSFGASQSRNAMPPFLLLAVLLLASASRRRRGSSIG